MRSPSDREAFRNLLVEFFAIKTSEELGGVELPPEEQLEKLRLIAAPRADDIIRKYEQSLAISSLTTSVIENLRDKLVARSRVSHLIEIAINISLLLVGLLIGAWEIFTSPAENPDQASFVLWAVLIIVIIQLFGNLYLKYFDKSR